jgi:RNA-directed DNA polymerase
MAGQRILTHPVVRKLQRTLYQQAKKQPEWKAWSLYSDLCRKEFIEEAMSRILSNGGGSGVDGYTVEAMEKDWERFRDDLGKELRERSYAPSPVKRIRIPEGDGGERELGIPTVKDRVVQMILVLLLEPVFEPDFHDESYGYRRGKRAKDAVESLCKGLCRGQTMAIEADLSRYFDTIGHARLMKLVVRRVSDGAVLNLVKRFLEVPVVEEAGSGMRTVPNAGKGVPQGGVISPLLANLYLDKLDHAVNALDPQDVKMIHYADDFVILVRKGREALVLERVKRWLSKARLTLNETKTKLTDTSCGGKVEFLGFELSERVSPRSGKRYIHCRPSAKSSRKFREKIRAELSQWTTWQTAELAVSKVNRITRGWGNYFHHGHSLEVFRGLNYWLKNRMRGWLVKKHKARDRSQYRVFPDALLQQKLGLYTLPSHAAWGNR